MSEILEKKTVFGGITQSQFVGLRVGEFILVPASDAGTRPDALRVEGPKENILLHGGTCLIAEVAWEGIFIEKYLRYLSAGQTKALRELAWNLPGRIWPIAGETMKKQVEKIGEQKIAKSF